MYEQVFNFNARPFTSTPYVKHYFGASAMNQSFGQAAICIQRGSGPVIAIGDIGTGKSLLLAKLAAEFQASFQIVQIDCSRVNSRKDLLQNILFQLGKPFNMAGETELRFSVIESANPTEASPNGLLLLVDDAETLSAEIFEEMRALVNIVVDGSPQVRLVLAGRKSLEERLAEPSLASFSQRIASRVFLDNLSRDETAAYAVEHINRVGGDGLGLFPAEATVKLHELTEGCPRLINQVCDFVLILASTRGATSLSAELIEEAWNDVQSLPMGSGPIAATHSNPAAETEQKSDWTLIEFGQLEDDSPEPVNATVYDFENSSDPVESIVGYTTQEDDFPSPTQPVVVPAPESARRIENAPEPQADLPVETSTTGIDPVLGIDLASLQAMQDAAAVNETLANSNEAPVTQAEAPAEQATASPTDHADRLAMEQQLAAVFGTQMQDASTPETPLDAVVEPVSNEASNFGPTAHHPVESPEAEVDQPTESNSIADIASASAIAAGLVAGASHLMTPENQIKGETFAPATPALDNPIPEHQVTETEQVTEPPTPEPPTPTNVPGTATGFTPAFSVDQFVPATNPTEANIESLVAETTLDPEIPKPAAQDPFDETFDVETTVPDRIARDTIAQNQNALKLSSADLSDLTPLHAPSPDAIVQQTDSGEPSTASATALPPGVNWLDSIAAQEKLAADKAVEETPESAPSPTETASAETASAESASEPAFEPAIEDASSNQPASSTNRGFAILPIGTPQPTEPEAVKPPSTLEPAPVPPVEPQAVAPRAQATSEPPQVPEPTPIHHTEHNNESISDEISRKADEILARLQNNANLAPAILQEEQILSNIQQQQREVSDSQLVSEPADQSVPLPEPTPHQDDSEMLVVNPATSSTETNPKPDTYPMTDSPISSGRATRMDYEQLFDRLRNQPEENQQ